MTELPPPPLPTWNAVDLPPSKPAMKMTTTSLSLALMFMADWLPPEVTLALAELLTSPLALDEITVAVST